MSSKAIPAWGAACQWNHHEWDLGAIWRVHSKHWPLATSRWWQAKPFHLRGHSSRYSLVFSLVLFLVFSLVLSLLFSLVFSLVTTSSQWQAKPFHLRGHRARWRRGPGHGDNALGNWVCACMHHNVASYKLCKPHRSDCWRMAQSTSGTFCE